MYYFYPEKFRNSYRLAVIETRGDKVFEHSGHNSEQPLAAVLTELREIRKIRREYKSYHCGEYTIIPVLYPQKSERFMALLLRARCRAGGV